VALSAALRDSLDTLISPLHERLTLIQKAIDTARRSRRRRRRMSSSSSDGEYSEGDGGRHVSSRSVTRAHGRELEGNPVDGFLLRSSQLMIDVPQSWIAPRTPWRIPISGMTGPWHMA